MTKRQTKTRLVATIQFEVSANKSIITIRGENKTSHAIVPLDFATQFILHIVSQLSHNAVITEGKYNGQINDAQ